MGRDRLANEAFLISSSGYKTVHHKQYFPPEPGCYERDWFAPSQAGFDISELRDTRFGALLCTELFFNERARHYRRLGAHIIAVPRAAGGLNTKWRAAASMTAVVSGCYVVSSNRSDNVEFPKGYFCGEGFVYAPDGALVAKTSSSSPVAFVEIDCAEVERAQAAYPCYVAELDDQHIPRNGSATPHPP